jgi:hypothetical protein
MTLTRRRVSPKVRPYQVGMADPGPVLGREPQVGGEGGAVGEQTPHGGRELALVAAGEGVDARLRPTDSPVAGSGVLGELEDLPERRLELVTALGGDLG